MHFQRIRFARRYPQQRELRGQTRQIGRRLRHPDTGRQREHGNVSGELRGFLSDCGRNDDSESASQPPTSPALSGWHHGRSHSGNRYQYSDRPASPVRSTALNSRLPEPRHRHVVVVASQNTLKPLVRRDRIKNCSGTRGLCQSADRTTANNSFVNWLPRIPQMTASDENQCQLRA
jgi:hypothetical protein